MLYYPMTHFEVMVYFAFPMEQRAYRCILAASGVGSSSCNPVLLGADTLGCGQLQESRTSRAVATSLLLHDEQHVVVLTAVGVIGVVGRAGLAAAAAVAVAVGVAVGIGVAAGAVVV